MQHGGNILEIAEQYGLATQDIIDFSANINPLGIPESIKQAIIQNIDQLKHYPDIRYRELTEAISQYHNCLASQVFVGNGAAEIIYSLPQVLETKKMLVLAPTFSEYESAFSQTGTEFSYYSLEDNQFNLSIEQFIEQAKLAQVDSICLCNPNNPTGQVLAKEDSLRLLDFCQQANILLVMDEAFMDFIIDEECSLADYLDQYSQLYIVRSLTKIFAIPGLRLGYLLTSDELVINQLNKTCPPWHINTLASLAGQAALQDKEYLEESLSYVKKERLYLIKELSTISTIEMYPSETNFLFFKWLGNVDLRLELISNGYLIRTCETFKGLKETYYRIAVRTHEENKGLVKAIQEIVHEKSDC